MPHPAVPMPIICLESHCAMLATPQRRARVSIARSSWAPEESMYHFSRALLARADGDLEGANTASARALALDPNRFDAYLLRIQLAIASRDFAEAERQIILAERADPNHPQLLFVAGQVALLKGDGDRAIKLLNKAAVEQPRAAQIFATLGSAYQSRGRSAFAEQSLRRAMAMDPGETRWRRLLVETLISQRQTGMADAELQVYRQHHPEDPLGIVLQAELRTEAGKTVEALNDFRAALKLAPRNMRALRGLQSTLAAVADRAQAREAWEAVLKDDTGLDPVWASRLFATDEESDYDEVLRRWREALPESVAAQLYQARRDEHLGREAEAAAGFDAVLARVPGQPDALAGKAVIALRNDPAASIESLNALIERSSQLQAMSALANRGLAHDRLEQPQLAVADWQQAQAPFGTPPVDVPMPPEASIGLIVGLPPYSRDTQVVMLWGPPGAGSERLAASLRLAQGRPMLQATPDARPRIPQYPEAFIERALNPFELAGVVSEIAPVYARMLEPHHAQGHRGVFDWLAQWDARVVPALRHALAGTRLIAVLRDSRDMLLNWLAFGAPASVRFGDANDSAAWLARQLEHLLFSRDALQLPVLVVDMDRFDADAAAVMQEIATFADLSTTPDPQPALRLLLDPRRLPTGLPAGRWRVYREAMAEAFEQLTPVAERLGYPRD